MTRGENKINLKITRIVSFCHKETIRIGKEIDVTATPKQKGGRVFCRLP